MLDFGILYNIARGTSRTGIAISWGSGTTLRLHIFRDAIWHQVFSS